MSCFGMVAPRSGQVGAEGEGGFVAVLQFEVAHSLGGELAPQDAGHDRLALLGVQVLAVTNADDLGKGLGHRRGRRLLVGSCSVGREERYRRQPGERHAELATCRAGLGFRLRSIHRLNLSEGAFWIGDITDPMAAIIVTVNLVPKLLLGNEGTRAGRLEACPTKTGWPRTAAAGKNHRRAQSRSPLLEGPPWPPLCHRAHAAGCSPGTCPISATTASTSSRAVPASGATSSRCGSDRAASTSSVIRTPSRRCSSPTAATTASTSPCGSTRQSSAMAC